MGADPQVDHVHVGGGGAHRVAQLDRDLVKAEGRVEGSLQPFDLVVEVEAPGQVADGLGVVAKGLETAADLSNEFAQGFPVVTFCHRRTA
ncbi:hypothetical protein GCM10010412_028500 [Nonomuraea recticatena]|uniref:Uncharacterized protein n=1 Tax=Nonomuraea recticatena TaxID=46178 RepID=A0ABP6E3U5_9ACTN